MIRRQFIKLAALTGATGIASLGTLDALDRHAGAGASKTVCWRVNGFTCITCAVGLETMLRRQKGVRSAEATYPEGVVTIQYDPAEVDQEKLRSFIAELGFRAVAMDQKKG